MEHFVCLLVSGAVEGFDVTTFKGALDIRDLRRLFRI